LQEQKSAAEKRAEILGTDLRRLQAELSAIRQASANTLQIQAERDDLQEQLIRLKRELETTRRAKQGLEEDDRQTWFLTGAGVLLAGIAGGVIIPRLSWRRRSGWDTY
jgi:SH3 domain protein